MKGLHLGLAMQKLSNIFLERPLRTFSSRLFAICKGPFGGEEEVREGVRKRLQPDSKQKLANQEETPVSQE